MSQGRTDGYFMCWNIIETKFLQKFVNENPGKTFCSSFLDIVQQK